MSLNHISSAQMRTELERKKILDSLHPETLYPLPGALLQFEVHCINLFKNKLHFINFKMLKCFNVLSHLGTPKWDRKVG